MPAQPLPVLAFSNAAAWARWLASHHASSSGVWVKMAKKGSEIPSIDYAVALREALIWGWIDGQKNRHDDQWWLQKFTPRGPRSSWSKINCAKAEALIAAGEMQAAGLAQVERAKADGRWQRAYDSPGSSKPPADFTRALRAIPRAARFFATIDAANRYAILYRIQTAKRPETRAARITKLVAMLARGEVIHGKRVRGKR